jgi:hypothetical protein
MFASRSNSKYAEREEPKSLHRWNAVSIKLIDKNARTKRGEYISWRKNGVIIK